MTDVNDNKQKTKRYYKLGEIVWVIDKKTSATITDIDKENLEMTVEYQEGSGTRHHTDKLWKFDKIKYKALEKLEEEQSILRPNLLFAKVKENAIIPKKAGKSEAGYDVWACLEPRKDIIGKEVYEIFLPKLKPTLIPTGIATCAEDGYYLNFANERGSTGKLGMLMLSGVVDNSYRGEVFLNIVPLYKDILITSEVEETEETEDLILYPYSKAVCQMIDYRVGESVASEITYEDLKEIPSDRKDGKLGSSGH